MLLKFTQRSNDDSPCLLVCNFILHTDLDNHVFSGEKAFSYDGFLSDFCRFSKALSYFTTTFVIFVGFFVYFAPKAIYTPSTFDLIKVIYIFQIPLTKSGQVKNKRFLEDQVKFCLIYTTYSIVYQRSQNHLSQSKKQKKIENSLQFLTKYENEHFKYIITFILNKSE